MSGRGANNSSDQQALAPQKYEWPMYGMDASASSLQNGLQYFYGTGVAQNFKTAADFFWDTLIEGDMRGAYCYGVCCILGLGVPQSTAMAVQMWQRAQNNDFAQFALGKCYQYGWGVNADENVAKQYFEDASRQGNERARQALQLGYQVSHQIPGPPVQQNAQVQQVPPVPSQQPRKASYSQSQICKMKLDQLQLAAQQGDQNAQYQLGFNYYNGKGAQYDHKLAAFWYGQAAAQGHAEAMYCLGNCYQLGSSGIKDPIRAFQLFCQAAEQGNAKAQFLLWRCYNAGIGTKVNKQLAMQWLTAAASNRNEKAIKELKQIQHQSTVQQNIAPVQDPIIQQQAPTLPMVAEQSAEQQPPIREATSKTQNRHAHSLFLKARKYFQGIDVEKDYQKAFSLYSQAAAQNHFAAMNQLGFLYERGFGVAKNIGQARLLYQQAAQAGNIKAQRNLQRCAGRQSQVYIKLDSQTVQQGMQQEANDNRNDHNDGPPYTPEFHYQDHSGCQELACNIAQRPVQTTKRSSVKTVIKPAENFTDQLQRATAGDQNYQYMIAKRYAEGQGVEQDDDLAVEWYEKAAQKGHLESIYALAICYRNGQGVNENVIRAFKLFKQAANKGHIPSMLELANCYSEGIGTQQDLNSAMEMYKKAANLGDESALRRLQGQCFSLSPKITQNLTSFQKYKHAAESGNATAQYNVAMCYLKGNGAECNYKTAFSWFQKAAQQKNVDALNGLGLCYLNGHGVQSNTTKAFAFFQEAAGSNQVDAFYNLAKCYLEGKGTVYDLNQAIRFLQKASESENSLASYTLGECCWMEIGLINDMANVFKLFEAAAKNGNSDSQYMLGNCYRYGWGTNPDHTLAMNWYQMATDQKNTKAMIQIVRNYLSRDNQEILDQVSLNLCQLLSERENPVGKYYLAQYQQYNRYYEKNDESHFKLYSKAESRGHTMAKYQLEQINLKDPAMGHLFARLFKKYKAIVNDDNMAAQYYLGVYTHFGLGIKEDHTAAANWYQMTYKRGYVAAIYALAVCYHYGEGVTQNEKKSMELLKMAAEAGHISAQYILGITLQAGSVQKGAISWLVKAAMQGHSKAISELTKSTLKIDKNDEDARSLFAYVHVKAVEGDVDAQYQVATYFLEGIGTQVNNKEGLKWLKAAADVQHVKAIERYAGCLLQTGQHFDREQAVALLTTASKHGSDTAIQLLSQIDYSVYCKVYTEFEKAHYKRVNQVQSQSHIKYLYQRTERSYDQWHSEIFADPTGGCKNIEQDVPKVVLRRQFLEKSAFAGNAVAQYGMGLFIQLTSRNARDAITWFEKAARQGDIDAAYELALCYENGGDDIVNHKKAIQFYTQAADEGHVEAQHALGMHYINGTLLQQDLQKGVALLQKAAQRKHFESIVELARCQLTGNGIVRNQYIALTTLRSLAEAGNVPASLCLSDVYLHGKGISKSKELALYWTQEAAVDGAPEGAFALGQLYRYGNCCAINIKEALKQYTKAASCQFEPAIALLADFNYSGSYVKQDLCEAAKYYQKLSNPNYQQLLNLAHCLKYVRSSRDNSPELEAIRALQEAAAMIRRETIKIVLIFE